MRIRRRRPSVLMVCLLLMVAPGASAQFIQYTPPGEFVSPAEAREDVLERAMREARWRFGRVLVDPWLEIRNLSYEDNVTPTAQGQEGSDLTIGIGAGINIYLPIGSDFIWSTFLLPQYDWWQDLEERRRLNGRYGTGLFGNFGRLGLELTASRSEESRVFSNEFEERVNQRHDEAEASFTFDLGKGILAFVKGSDSTRRSLEDEPFLDALKRLDRDEQLTQVGLSVDLGDGFRVGISHEESDVDFGPARLDRSNSGSSTILDMGFDGEVLDVVATAASREIDPVPGSVFVPHDDVTASFSVGLKVFSRTRFELFGGRDLVYSLQDNVSHLEGERLGFGVTTSLGSTGSVRLFAEAGEDRYVPIDQSFGTRTDDRDALGARLNLRFGQFILGFYAVRNEYDSSNDDFDREFTRAGASISLGTSRLSPWG